MKNNFLQLFLRPTWWMLILLLELLQRSLVLVLAFLLLFFWWLTEAPWQTSLPPLLAPLGIELQNFQGTPWAFTVESLDFPLLPEKNTEKTNTAANNGHLNLRGLSGQLQLRPWPALPLLRLEAQQVSIRPPASPDTAFSLPPPFRLPPLPKILPFALEVSISKLQLPEVSAKKINLTGSNQGPDWHWRSHIDSIKPTLLPEFSLAMSGHYAVEAGRWHLEATSNLFNEKQQLSLHAQSHGGRFVFRQYEKNGGQWQMGGQWTWYPDYALRLDWGLEQVLLKAWLQQLPEFWQTLQPFWQVRPLAPLHSQGQIFIKNIKINNNLPNFELLANLTLDSSLAEQKLNLVLKNAKITPQQIDFEELLFSLDEQQLALAGQLSLRGVDLKGVIDFPKLSAIVPEFSGSIHSQWQAQGRLPWPKIQAQAQIKNLNIPAFKISDASFSLDSQKSSDWQKLPAVSAKLLGKNWQFADNQLQNIEVFLETPGFSLKNFPQALTQTWPPLTLTFAAKQVKSPSFALENADLRAEIAKSGQAKLYGKWQQLKIQALPKQSLRGQIQGQGQLLNHDFSLDLQTPTTALRLALRAGFQQNIWQAKINELFFKEEKLGSFRLANAATMTLSPTGAITLENFCLQQLPLKLCQRLDFYEQKITGQGSLENLTLEKLQSLAPLPEGIDLQGQLQAHWQGALQLANLQQSQGQLTLSSSPLLLTISNLSPPLTWNFSPLSLSLLWQNGLNAELNLKGDYGLALVGQLQSSGQKIKGDLSLKINALSEVIAPFLQNFGSIGHSQLQLTATLGGQVQAPQVSGAFHGESEKFLLYALNQPFEKIKFTGKVHPEQALHFTLSAQSEAPLAIDGVARVAATGFTINSRLQGNAVKIANLPEVQLWLSPDLKLAFANTTGLAIHGDVTIPKARIVLKQLPPDTVKVSSDARVITEENPEATKANRMPLAVTADINVKLGQEISIEAFDFKSFLKGELRLRQNAQQTKAHGRLILQDGQYRAYGQDLKIDPGFIFFHGPPTAPSVDITAYRQRLDHPKVGIRLLGTIDAPRVYFLSEPAVSDAEALSLLVTGKSLRQLGRSDGNLLQDVLKSSGLDFGNEALAPVAARLGLDRLTLEAGEGENLLSGLRFGKYLSPRLYVEYLAGNPDAWKIQYRLHPRLRLQLEQSLDYQAGDLLYSFEK